MVLLQQVSGLLRHLLLRGNEAGPLTCVGIRVSGSFLVFLKARKRYDHVSTLHVFHHSIMPIFTWQACRFIPGETMTILLEYPKNNYMDYFIFVGGHESFAGLLNTFTRVILFSHQALASTSPAIQVSSSHG